jgi:hypothetical protein
MEDYPQMTYYHTKTNNEINQKKQFITAYEIFEKYNFELPKTYENIYNTLINTNLKPTRKYTKKTVNKCIVINRNLNRITFD